MASHLALWDISQQFLYRYSRAKMAARSDTVDADRLSLHMLAIRASIRVDLYLRSFLTLGSTKIYR